MSLRLQLLALGALTLLLPLAGVQMVRQVEASLRAVLEQTLLERAGDVARRITEAGGLPAAASGAADPGNPLYAHRLSTTPRLDGLGDDWRYLRDTAGVGTDRAVTLTDGSRLALGIANDDLFVRIEVADDDVVYQRAPGQPPHGDRVVLSFGQRSPGALLLTNSAPGPFRAQRTTGSPRFVPSGSFDELVRAAWRQTATGYAIEARLPLRIVDGALGVGIIDSEGGANARLAAATWRDAESPNRLVREDSRLNRLIEPFGGPGERVRVVDAAGWIVADSGALLFAADDLAADDPAASRPSTIERLFRSVLRRDDADHAELERRPGSLGDSALSRAIDGEPAAEWYRRGAAVSAIVAVATPIAPGPGAPGAVVLERTTDPILTLTNQAMMRLIGITALVILLTAAGLLAYASFLSLRISRLARAADSALGPRGEIATALPGTTAGDEIGDLSRSFADLLERLRDYTDYLKSLKSKLSHELRTPLAIVATSTDNLEHETQTEPGRRYLARLRHGAERLESILNAMTAATRVEQAVAEAEHEIFDLGPLLASCVAAYRDIYAPREFVVDAPAQGIAVRGSAELIEQLLDKLIDNAAGFARKDSAIEIRLAAAGPRVTLEVINRGPLLPEAMRHQLFDSLVSVRAKSGSEPHLGLGLYIVTLIADFHDAGVSAANLEDGSGVVFRVDLSRADAGAA